MKRCARCPPSPGRRKIWLERVEAEGGTRAAALLFWAIALAGFAAAPWRQARRAGPISWLEGHHRLG